MTWTPPPLLTPEEKVKVRHHLGFLGVAEAFTMQAGIPAGVETQFILEGAMNRILPQSLPLARDLIAKCDQTEEQFFEYQDALVANKVGSIELAGRKGQQAILKQYNYWRQGLANMFGAFCNPYDMREDLQSSNNIRVM